MFTMRSAIVSAAIVAALSTTQVSAFKAPLGYRSALRTSIARRSPVSRVPATREEDFFQDRGASAGVPATPTPLPDVSKIAGEVAEEVKKLPGTSPLTLQRFLTGMTSCSTVYLLQHSFGFNNVFAASLVNIIGGILLPGTLSPTCAMGSFTGTASSAVIPNVGVMAGIALFSATLLMFFERRAMWNGRGGRLGFAGMCTITAYSMILGLFTKPVHAATNFMDKATAGYFFDKAPYAYAAQQGAGHVLPVFGVQAGLVTLAACLTRAWQAIFDAYPRLKNPVTSSAAIGLLGYFTLPAALAVPFAVGGYVSMSTQAVLPRKRDVVSAGMWAGFMQVAMAGMILGWGGKLGTVAFLGVGSSIIFRNLVAKLKA